MAKFKKGQVSVTRAREMADSLKHEAFWDSKAAKELYFKGKSATNASDKQMYKRALDKSNKLVDYNRLKAERYENAANKAMAQAGRDKPLPSSDGILSTIKNWFE